MYGFIIFISIFFLIPWGLYKIVTACIEESVRRHDAAERQRDREKAWQEQNRAAALQDDRILTPDEARGIASYIAKLPPANEQSATPESVTDRRAEMSTLRAIEILLLCGGWKNRASFLT